MRKIGIALALAAAALFAQGVRPSDAGQEAKKAGSEVSGEAQKTGERWKEAEERAVGSPGSSVDAKLFSGKSNFDVDGKIEKVSTSSITIARQGMPAATLGVAKGAKVQLDGNDVSISQLKPGQDVKASFNLDGNQPTAVELRAKAGSK